MESVLAKIFWKEKGGGPCLRCLQKKKKRERERERESLEEETRSVLQAAEKPYPDASPQGGGSRLIVVS